MNSGMRSALRAGAASLLMVGGNVLAADVTIHGLIDVWVGGDKRAGEGTRYVLNEGGLSTSYLGVSATHQVAPGLIAFGNLELFFRPDTGEAGRFSADFGQNLEGDAFFSRAAHVGLEGHLGRLAAGRNTTPYFLSTILTNPFGDSFWFSPSVLHTYAFRAAVAGPTLVGDSTWSNSVVYDAPSQHGLSASAAYAFGEEAGDGAAGSKFGSNVFYRSGRLVATAALNHVDHGGTGTGSQSAALLGLNYDLGAVELSLQYQRLEDDMADDAHTVTAGAMLPLAGGYALAATAYTDFSAADSRTTVAVGYMYPLSPALDGYLAVLHDDDGGATSRSYGLGARYRF